MKQTLLTPSQQLIVASIVSAVVDAAIVAGVMSYQRFTDRWPVSDTELTAVLVVIFLGLTIKNIVQMLVASERQQQIQDKRAMDIEWQAWHAAGQQPNSLYHSDTAPLPVVPDMTQPVHRTSLRDYK